MRLEMGLEQLKIQLKTNMYFLVLVHLKLPATVPVTLGRPPPSPIRGMTGLHLTVGLR
jgi:hypothetical protein